MRREAQGGLGNTVTLLVTSIKETKKITNETFSHICSYKLVFPSSTLVFDDFCGPIYCYCRVVPIYIYMEKRQKYILKHYFFNYV